MTSRQSLVGRIGDDVGSLSASVTAMGYVLHFPVIASLGVAVDLDAVLVDYADSKRRQ